MPDQSRLAPLSPLSTFTAKTGQGAMRTTRSAVLPIKYMIESGPSMRSDHHQVRGRALGYGLNSLAGNADLNARRDCLSAPFRRA